MPGTRCLARSRVSRGGFRTHVTRSCYSPVDPGGKCSQNATLSAVRGQLAPRGHQPASAATTSAAVALTWRIAPKTSPVIPPSRRRAVRCTSQPASSPASAAPSPRAASAGPPAGEARRHDGAGERAGRERALRRRGPAGDEGAEPAGPGGGGGGRDDDRHPAGDLGEHKRGGGQRQPGYRRDRRHLDKQHQHERADPHRADVGAAHDLQRGGGGTAAAEPVGGIGEPVEVQAAGEHGDQPRPRAPPRAAARGRSR